MAEQLSAQAQAMVDEGMRLVDEFALASNAFRGDNAETPEGVAVIANRRSLRANLERMAARIGAAEEEIRILKLGEEGAQEAFGAVVDDKRDLEREVARLRKLLEGAHESVRHYAARAQVQPTLDRPARVGGATFGAGLDVVYVIEAAQRAYSAAEEEAVKTPEQRREDEIKRRKMWDMIHGPVGQLAREPLSEERIEELAHQQGDYDEKHGCWSFNAGPDCRYNLVNLVRVIEREHEHGITQGEQP